MAKTQFERDGAEIGFTVESGVIIMSKAGRGNPDRGPRAGAQVTVESSMGAPSTMARLTTSVRDQGKLQGRSKVFVTVACVGGVTLIKEVEGKHELAARRWAAVVNAG